jgi:hypothetical protein
VAFFEEDIQVGTDVRSGESFSILATQEYIVAPPSTGVTKAILTISVTVNRNGTATRINEIGQLEIVAPNTPRFSFEPQTLQPLGLLIKHAVTNFASGDMATDWAKEKVALEGIYLFIGALIPVYRMQGDGVNGTHALSILFAQTSATQTISCYFKSGTDIIVQLDTGSYFNPFINCNLANGTITRQGSGNLAATIEPGPNEWY